VLFLLLLDSLLVCSGSVLIRKWAVGSPASLAVVGISLYNLGSVFWLVAMRRGMPLGRAAVVFGMMNLVLAVLAGLAMFKERLTPIQWAGVAFALISVVLVEG
jgi:drug/metabolite transporter (DMT)-like permease